MAIGTALIKERNTKNFGAGFRHVSNATFRQHAIIISDGGKRALLLMYFPTGNQHVCLQGEEIREGGAIYESTAHSN